MHSELNLSQSNYGNNTFINKISVTVKFTQKKLNYNSNDNEIVNFPTDVRKCQVKKNENGKTVYLKLCLTK